MSDVRATGRDEFGVRGTFYSKPLFDQAASDREGRPIYTPTIYILIEADHDNKTVFDLPLKEPDQYKDKSRDPRVRWADAWKQFQDGISGEVDGTPIEAWNMLPKHRCLELRDQGIKSLEQLANMPDRLLSGIGPDAAKLREGAQLFLKPADLATQGLKQENADLKKQMLELKSEFTQLQNQRFGEEDPAPGQPKKRGRKTNEERARLAAEGA